MSEDLNQFKSDRIKSYIRRQGRITPGQRNALTAFSDEYCLHAELDHFNVEQIYGQKNPLIIEIGFGNGDCLAEYASLNSDKNFLGIEVHTPGVGHLLINIEQNNLKNIRIFQADAVSIIENKIDDRSIQGVHIFFPDPWPKRKHHKRRIINAEFIQLLLKKLLPEGYIHIATDWEHYAKDIIKLFSNIDDFTDEFKGNYINNRPMTRPATKFEIRGINKGHNVWDMIYKKKL